MIMRAGLTQYLLVLSRYLKTRTNMKVALGILYGCMHLLLSAVTVKSSGDVVEIIDTEEFDNSVAGIIDDGLRLAVDDSSDSETGSNLSSHGQQENNALAINSHRILPPVVPTPPAALQDAVTMQPTVGSPTDAATSVVTTPSTTTPRSTTDERRIFNIVNPLLTLFTAGNIHTVATTTSPPTTSTTTTTATTVSTTIVSTTVTGNVTTDVTTVQPGITNSTISEDISDATERGINVIDGRRRILIPQNKPTRSIPVVTVDDTLRCGYPPICDAQRCRVLNATGDTLESCEVPGAKGGFLFMIVLLALIIIVGNSMLPIIVWRNRDMRVSHNLMKVSLAAADGVLGFVLLFSVVPNVVQTMDSTEVEVVRMIRTTANSPQAIIAGAMITLSAQASLFHLTYLSMERFVAIKWPLWHRFKAQGSLKLHISMIWILSIVAAFIPAAFPQSFKFLYQPVLFVYILTSSGSNYVTVGTLYLIITMIIPFLISVILTAATGIVVWIKMRSTSDMRRYSSTNSRWTERSSTQNGSKSRSRHGTKSNSEQFTKELKPEVRVFKTTVIMILAFCITLLPFITVALLFNAGYLDCLSYHVPLAGAFYACTSNSFINVLIYTARDRKFRGGWEKILKLSKNSRWMTGRWKSQKTKSSACANSVQLSQRPGHYATSTESSKEKWEKSLVKY